MKLKKKDLIREIKNFTINWQSLTESDQLKIAVLILIVLAGFLIYLFFNINLETSRHTKKEPTTCVLRKVFRTSLGVTDISNADCTEPALQIKISIFPNSCFISFTQDRTCASSPTSKRECL